MLYYAPSSNALSASTTCSTSAQHRRSSYWDSDNDSDDEDNDTLLCRDGVAICSSHSRMHSNNNSNNMDLLHDSLMYSEDEGASAKNDESSSLVHSCSNTKTLHSGTFFLENTLDQVQTQTRRSVSSRSSSFESEDSCCYFNQQDHYFVAEGFMESFPVPGNIRGGNVHAGTSSNSNSSSVGTDDDCDPPRRGTATCGSRCSSLEVKLNNFSFDDDCFIFSDDNGSTESLTKTAKHQHNESQRGMLLGNQSSPDATVLLDNSLEVESYNLFTASTTAAHLPKNRHRPSEAAERTAGEQEKLDQFHHMLERQLASHALPRAAPPSPPRSDDTGETASLSPSAAGSPSSPPHRAKALLGRVWGRRRGTPSSLDRHHHHGVEETINQDDNAVHNTVDSGVNKIFTAHSTHRVSDLAMAAAMAGSSAKRNLLVDFGAWEAAVSRQDKEEVCLQDDNDDEKSVLFIKSVSLFVQDFVSSKARPPPPLSRLQPNLATDVREGLLEPRTAAEDIASALDVAEEGRQLLTRIRGRAGVIDDLEPDLIDEVSRSERLPWIHLQDDVWMPHYEEYVIRSVHHFQQHLQRSMEASCDLQNHESGTPIAAVQPND